MNEEEKDLSNLIAILLNTYSQNETDRAESEKQIMEMKNEKEIFLFQLTQVIQITDAPLPAVQLSLILISQMLQAHSLSELIENRELLMNNHDLNESLKKMIDITINNEDKVVKNFSAKSYALLFQALHINWIDGLSLIASFVSNTELHMLERFSYLQAFYEISQLTDYEKTIFFEDVFLLKYREILSQCIIFIGTDQLNEEVSTDIRTISSRCIINFFHIANKNETSFINDNEFYKILIDALQFSFPIPDFNLFQCLLQLMEYMIIYGYNIIDDFLETIFNYSMNCFDIPNSLFCEATLFFWGEIAQFEYLRIIQGEMPVKKIAEQSAEAVLQVCKSIFDNANLSEVLNISSDSYSLISTAQVTITYFFQCAPSTVFDIITQKFQIFGTESSPFTTFCFLSSITIETNSIPFSEQFLLFVHHNWENILFLEHQALTEPTLIKDENMICTRAFALISLKLLINTLQFFPNLLLKLPQPEHPTKKLDDIFTLIKNNQDRQKQEHPAILICYARLIGAICYRKDKKYSNKQQLYINTNYDHLARYLWSLLDLNFSQYDYLLLESATINLDILIANSLIKVDGEDHILCFDFLVFLFTYIEEKLQKSNSLFETQEVRYSFQKSFCSIIGSLGTIIATDNDVCQRSFETLMSLVQNPNNLIYEDALRSVAMFIPKVKDYIDPNIIIPLTMNAVNSLNSESNQIITSASFLLTKVFESVPDKVFDVIQDAFQSLQRVLLEKINLGFRESQYSILIALSTLFSNIDNKITENFKDDFLSLIDKLKDAINNLNTYSQDDLKYANRFYSYLLDCLLSYVNAFLPKIPKGIKIPEEALSEQKDILKLLSDLASNIYKIPDEKKTDELLDFYLELVSAITERTSRKNGIYLNKLVITKPIQLAIVRNEKNENKRKYLYKLQMRMRSI